MWSLHPHPFHFRCCILSSGGTYVVSHCGWRIASLLAKAWLLCRHLAGGDFVGLSPWNLHIGSGAAIPVTWLASHCPSWPWAGPCRTLTSLLPRPCAGHLCPLCMALSWPYCVLCFRPCAGLTAWFPGPEQAWRYLDFGPEQAVLLRAVLALCWPLVNFVIKIGPSTTNSIAWWLTSFAWLGSLRSPLPSTMSGGTGSASTAGLDVNTTKDSYIPVFSGAPSDYKEWRKRLTIYVMKMRMAKREAEGLLSVIGSLTGTAWRLLENFPIEEIEKAGAFEKILKTLDKAFEYDKSVQLPTDFDKYFSGLHRRPGQSLLEYTTEHDHLYNKFSDHDVTLPGKVQGWHLLRKAGLTREQRQLVIAKVPTMERNKVQEALFLLLGQDHKTVGGGAHHQHRGFRGKGRAYAAYEDDANDMEPDDWDDDDGLDGKRDTMTGMMHSPMPLHRLLTAMWMRPMRTLTLMLPTTKPWMMLTQQSRRRSSTRPTLRTWTLANASTRSNSAVDTSP